MQQAVELADNVHFHNEHPSPGDVRRELLEGLQAPRKTVDPKWFYDARGSALFEQITRLPEYYPTRTETAILRDNRQAISRRCGNGCVLIEPGAGSCAKVRLLLDTLRPAAYVPLDISEGFLRDASELLGREYPWLTIHAVCADFNQGWFFAQELPPGKRVVFYPGSTIGNLEPQEAVDFMRRVRALIGAGGGLLIGVDLHKSSARLDAAYNDASGVTAQFNLNVIHRINDVLQTDMDPAAFEHRAFYNREQRRIEMHLVSAGRQSIPCNDQTIEFEAGESIHTENSYKYTVETFAEMAASAGLELRQTWFDENKLFSVHYLEAGDA
ncbi:MAG: L-histidine N(alpha)-methyltransferase [Halioglobus sp.]|nr:L-histidine N(alpha)-methyltransferase [Halioglobus sp.]